MISIELITRGEPELKYTLDSISNQNFKNYELVCIDSSGKSETRDILSTYDCRVVELPIETKHLVARYEANKYANGDRVLILDATRPLLYNALSILDKSYANHDMVVIREGSIGKGFWVHQANILKNISEMQSARLNNEVLGFLLPRFYNRKILSKALDNIVDQTGPLFTEISYGEHHLIFEECMKLSRDFILTKEILISHYEDDTLLKILKKYYWYGKSQKVLKKLKDSETTNLKTHMRKNVGLRNRIKTLPINTARGLPFIVGYIFG